MNSTKDRELSRNPQTAEEFLEQGSIDEESGDRWLGSDLSKALRFYNKAYEAYLKSIEVSKFADLDSYYNSSRLLFHVYNHYTNSGIKYYQLTNIDEVLGAGNYSVVQELPLIVRAHEKAIDVATNAGEKLSTDLLYNTALVYVEVLEYHQDKYDANFDDLLSLSIKAQELLKNVIEQQTKDLKAFIDELQGISAPKNEESDSINPGLATSNTKEEEFTSEEVLQPTDIFETIQAGYQLAQSILENITNPEKELIMTLDCINPFLTTCDNIAQELWENFSEATNKIPDMISSLTENQMKEYIIMKKIITGLAINNLDQLLEHWNDSTLPNTPSRFNAASDNIQVFLDRYDIDVSTANSNPDVASLLWKALSSMTNNYKKAQELLNIELNEKKKLPSGVEGGIGSLLVQVSAASLSRADIDIQRCQLKNFEASVKNHDVLLQNAKTLLKNTMTVANSTGGLREAATEKFQRENKKIEACLRMCILENKHSIDELDSIIGRISWVNELPNIKKLGYYEVFGINNIDSDIDFS